MRLKDRKWLSALIAFCTASLVGQTGAAVADGCQPPWCELPGNGYQEHGTWETQGFAGIQWNFTDASPELVVGLRRTDTRSDDEVVGGKADLTFKLDPKLFLTPTIRGLAVVGGREIQGEAGIGLRTSDGKPLVAAGVQVPFGNAGANYVLGDGLKLYAGVNSLVRPEGRTSNGLSASCPGGYNLVNAAQWVRSDVVSNGKTCEKPQ